jgi:hypothetical protein
MKRRSIDGPIEQVLDLLSEAALCRSKVRACGGAAVELCSDHVKSILPAVEPTTGDTKSNSLRLSLDLRTDRSACWRLV